MEIGRFGLTCLTGMQSADDRHELIARSISVTPLSRTVWIEPQLDEESDFGHIPIMHGRCAFANTNGIAPVESESRIRIRRIVTF